MSFFGKIAKILLGKGFLHRITLLEFKRFLSVYVHIFNTVEQDRFHTHAFNGLALLLHAGYKEEVMQQDGTIAQKYIRPGIRYIPEAITTGC